MINAFQSLVLVLLDSETCDQNHRNKTARKQQAAIDLLKKKIVSTTTPNSISTLRKGTSRDVAVL